MKKVYQCDGCSGRFEADESRFSGAETICPACGGTFPSKSFAEIAFCPHCRSEVALGLNVAPGVLVRCPTCGGEFRTAEVAADAPANGETPPMLEPGDFFDKYRIERLLGRGGMGEVYLARHRLMNRECALKILTLGTADSGAAARFVQEAKLANRLEHPNLITVFDVGSDLKTGKLFLAMEYVDGESLRDLMTRRTFSERELLSIGIEVCKALAAMEKSGIVHRDIKPANIMIDRQGRVKLADLGIAKSENRQYGDITLTRGAEVFGTPEYASPEQCRAAHDADHRSDIYSLGATLYHLACGQPPYDGSTSLEIVLKVLKEEPVGLKERAPALSDGFAALIGDMMRRDPAQRPQHASELVSRMTELRRRLPMAVTIPSPEKRRTEQPAAPSRKNNLPWIPLTILAVLIAIPISVRFLRQVPPVSEGTEIGEDMAFDAAPAEKPAEPEKTASAATETKEEKAAIQENPATAAEAKEEKAAVQENPATAAEAKEEKAAIQENPATAAEAKEENPAPAAADAKEAKPAAQEEKPAPAPTENASEPAVPMPLEADMPPWLAARLEHCRKMLDVPEVKKAPARLSFFRKQQELLERQAENVRLAREAAKREYSAENTRKVLELFPKVRSRLWQKNVSASPEYRQLAALFKNPRTDPNVGFARMNFSSPVMELSSNRSSAAAGELLKILLDRHPLVPENYSASDPRLIRYGVPKISYRAGNNSDTLETCLLAGMPPGKLPKRTFFSGDRNLFRGFELTHLHFAVLRGWNSTVAMLIAAGADVSQTDDEGQTALHYAYKYGRQDLAKPLLDAGCDPGRKDKRGRSARECAGDQALYRACFDRDLARMQELVRTADDANILLESGYTALEWACAGIRRQPDYMSLRMVRNVDPKPALLLLERGADPMRGGLMFHFPLISIMYRMSFSSPDAARRLPELEMWLQVLRKILDRPGGDILLFSGISMARRGLSGKPFNAQLDALQREYRKIIDRTIQEIPDAQRRDSMQRHLNQVLQPYGGSR